MTPPRGAPFLNHGWLKISSVTNGFEKLLARNFVFHIRAGLEVRGLVLDPDGKPAPGVLIIAGSYHSNSRASTSSLSGEILTKGWPPGRQIVTALDRKRGAAFEIVDVTSNTPPVTLKLQPFRTLHLRVVDAAGVPVAGARVVWQMVDETLKTFSGAPGDPTPQYSFETFTDQNGEITWREAPADSVLISIYPEHHEQIHDRLVRADGSLQTIMLRPNFPTQTITGTVRDAATGAPISPIRIRRGYPSTSKGVTIPKWYSSPRDTTDFEGGTFHFEFDYTPDEGPSRFSYLFEISAEGYQPVISRIVKGDEGNVQLEFLLQRTNATKLAGSK